VILLCFWGSLLPTHKGMTMDIVKERQHDSFCPVKQAEAVLYVVEFKPMAARFLEGI
jgi:hypothetical protein